MRLLDVADIDDQVVDADRGYRFRRRVDLCHSMPSYSAGAADGLLAPKARAVGAVDQRFGTLARQVLEPVDRAVDVVFPHLARQFVEELDAVAVRVVDVDAVRHAVIDPPVELDALALQEGELLQPRLAARHRQRDVVDRDLAVGQHPLGRRRQVRALDQSDVWWVSWPSLTAL